MFGEQTKEWSPKDGMELQVVLSPKYIQTRANAMEIIQKHPYFGRGLLDPEARHQDQEDPV